MRKGMREPSGKRKPLNAGEKMDEMPWGNKALTEMRSEEAKGA